MSWLELTGQATGEKNGLPGFSVAGLFVGTWPITVDSRSRIYC